MKINRQIEVEIELEVYELVNAFWSLSADDQARFFNKLNFISSHRICDQLQAIKDSPHLHSGGRYVMAKIGEYSE